MQYFKHTEGKSTIPFWIQWSRFCFPAFLFSLFPCQRKMVLTIEEIEGYEEASKAWKARILSMEYLHNLRNEILALEESQCRESHQLVVDVIKYCLLCMWLRKQRLIVFLFPPCYFRQKSSMSMILWILSFRDISCTDTSMLHPYFQRSLLNPFMTLQAFTNVELF